MNQLEKLKNEGLFRKLICLKSLGAKLEYQGNLYLNLSSNDYLGISGRLDLQKAFFEQLSQHHFLMSTTSSRLLTGNNEIAEELEYYLCSLYKRPASLLFNSGYHANIGILPAITDKNDLIIADKLVHASIIDGLRLCNCKWMRYKHNDCEDLERLLKQAGNKYKTIYIVTESIFSMDGDCVDLEVLVDLKKRYTFKLYIDEAHSLGVRGSKGLGLIEEKGLLQSVDLIVGTLGKALASEGAFLICDINTKQLLINKSRSLIFTTATAPINLLWTRFIFEEMVKMQDERLYLKEITELFRSKLSELTILGNTHIVPLVLGDNEVCLNYAQQLKNKGLWAMPIRYPSVPLHQARIRFSLTAAFSKQEIQTVYETILA